MDVYGGYLCLYHFISRFMDVDEGEIWSYRGSRGLFMDISSHL